MVRVGFLPPPTKSDRIAEHLPTPFPVPGRHGRQAGAHSQCCLIPYRPQGHLHLYLSVTKPSQHIVQTQASPLAQRIQFLEAKGLTGPEIEEAMRQANGSGPRPSHIQQPPYGPVYGPLPYVPQPNPPWDWRDYFVRAANCPVYSRTTNDTNNRLPP